MADQIRTFLVNMNLIDESGNIDANKLSDDIVKKIQEIPGVKIQLMGVNLSIQQPGQTVQRHLKDIQIVDQGGQKKLEVVDVPKEYQQPPQPGETPQR